MPLLFYLVENDATRINRYVFDMQMGIVSSMIFYDNEPALLTLYYRHRTDCLRADNDCMTILNGQNYEFD